MTRKLREEYKSWNMEVYLEKASEYLALRADTSELDIEICRIRGCAECLTKSFKVFTY